MGPGSTHSSLSLVKSSFLLPGSDRVVHLERVRTDCEILPESRQAAVRLRTARRRVQPLCERPILAIHRALGAVLLFHVAQIETLPEPYIAIRSIGPCFKAFVSTATLAGMRAGSPSAQAADEPDSTDPRVQR